MKIETFSVFRGVLEFFFYVIAEFQIFTYLFHDYCSAEIWLRNTALLLSSPSRGASPYILGFIVLMFSVVQADIFCRFIM